MAPGTLETVGLLKEKHSAAPAHGAIPDELRNVAAEWAKEIDVDEEDAIKAVNGGGNGKSADRFGWVKEYYTALIKDAHCLELVTLVLRYTARGEVPKSVAAASAGARLVAILKERGGIRPIGITDILQRIAGRIITKTNKDAYAESLHAGGVSEARDVRASVHRAEPGALSLLR
jgi:hypothetical protein